MCQPSISIPPLAIRPDQFDGFKHIVTQTTPGLIFAAEGTPFEIALRYAAEQGVEVVLGGGPLKGLSSTEYEELTTSWRKGAANKARAHITPETVAKVHYTGTNPSDMVGIVTSQVTMSINQDALAQNYSCSDSSATDCC